MPNPNLFTDTAGGIEFSVASYLAGSLPDMVVPSSFKHTPPYDPRPTEPSTGGLGAGALAEVNAWKNGLVAPTLAAAITYKSDYETYNALLDAWIFANQTARVTQYRLAVSDSTVNNLSTVSQSGDTTGTGTNPPPPAVFPRNVP